MKTSTLSRVVTIGVFLSVTSGAFAEERAPSYGAEESLIVVETLGNTLSTDLWEIKCGGKGTILADVGINNPSFEDNKYRVTLTCTAPGKNRAADTETVVGTGISSYATVNDCVKGLIAYQCDDFCDEGYDTQVVCVDRKLKKMDLLQDQ